MSLLTKRNCLIAMLLLLLGTAFFGTQSFLPTAWAQTQDQQAQSQQTQTDTQTEPETDPEAEAPTDVESTSDPEEATGDLQDSQQVGGRFIPTEEISQDLGVSFPVDI